MTCTLPENMPLHVLQPAKRTYAVGDQVALQCSPEFDQSGATFTECGPDGQFSEIDTVCELSKFLIMCLTLVECTLHCFTKKHKAFINFSSLLIFCKFCLKSKRL